MNLPELCIRRPVMTTLLTAALCVFGIMAYRLLPVSDLPNVDFPTIQVSASLPGASPETMASAVATPLEQQFSTVAGIDSMTSTSSLGSTQITLQFALDRNIDAAAQDVQTAIAGALRNLPNDMPAPPSLRKTNPADKPVLYLALSSPTLPLSVVDEYAETELGQRISMVDGVSQVSVYGSQKFAVRVQIDPNALASRGISLADVQAALAAHNVNLPTGVITGRDQAVTVVASGQLDTSAEFRRMVIAYRNGAPVRLGAVARVIDSVQNTYTASWFNGTRAVILAVQRQPGTNTIEVVDRVKALLPSFEAQLPAAVHLSILHDKSVPVHESVNDVQFTLLLAVALVVMVIFVFLRSARATFIPAVAIPMALFGTFILMYFSGYTLDNFSLLALTLSIGFVVDDAIVILENIVRHVEQGMPVRAAAFQGSREIGFTILSMTMSLVAVFIPVMFMGGVLGRLLHEFAITITAAIIMSGVVSLTLSPMLCSRFLRPHAAGGTSRKQRLYQATERAFDRLLAAYGRTLQVCLRHRLATLGALGLTVVFTAAIALRMPLGFIPTEDDGTLFAFTEGAQDISFDAMVRHQQAAAAIIQRDPAVAEFMSSVGGGPNAAGFNSGRFFIELKPRGERDPAPVVVQRLRRDLAVVPGLKVYPQQLPSIRIGGSLTKAQYQFTLSGTNLDELYATVPGMVDKIRALPGLQDVNSDMQISSPQVRVKINRDRAAALGVTPEQIESALYSAYGSRQVSTIYTPTNQYYVIMELGPKFQLNADSLAMIYLSGRDGQRVPLDSVATLQRGVGPLTINHLGQMPAVTISFNLAPGHSLGEATGEIEALARRTLPATISYSFQGAAQAFASSLQGLGLLLVLAVLVIYIVLGVLYEDFIHPLTILSGLPAAGFGALLTLWLFHEELNIMGYVGIIMLIGIVKKNAIMMIDFALVERAKGEGSAEQAIYNACMVRFRPIMMTSCSALAGTLPIALGLGAGAAARRPLGLAVVGGLVVSQLLTLYITPVIYVYMERLSRRLGRKAELPRGLALTTQAAPAGK